MFDQRTTTVRKKPFAIPLAWGLAGAVCLVALDGRAQSIEAQRYKSSQGIEIIQNRVAPTAPSLPVNDKPVAVNGMAVPSDTSRATVTTTKSSASGAAATPSASLTSLAAASPQGARDARQVVSTKTQGLRDAERLEILQQELSKEKLLHAHTLKTLQTPELKAKLSDEEGQRYAFMRGLHEQNIAALTKEISRIPVGR